MDTMKKENMLLKLASILALLAVAFCVGAGASENNDLVNDTDTITLVDSAGRTVQVPYPVESVVVLWSNPARELRALGVVDRIIGMEQSTKDEVDMGKLPELADVPVVGTQEEPNYEKIAQLKPDVVIALSAGYPPEPAETSRRARTRDYLVREGNRDVELAIIPGVDHSFQEVPDDEDLRLRERMNLESFHRPYSNAYFQVLESFLNRSLR